MPAVDWTQLIGQGGFVFFAVALFAAIIYAARWCLNELVKPGFQMFREFLSALTTQVTRMAEANEATTINMKKLADSNEATTINMKKLADSHAGMEVKIDGVHASVQQILAKWQHDSLEKPRS